MMSRFAFVVMLYMVSGCLSQRQPERFSALLSPGFSDLQRGVRSIKPNFNIFLKPGPFPVSMRKNVPITLSPDETIYVDMYMSDHGEEAPLVIFQHGNKSFKESHSKQAERMASWGMHAITVEQKNFRQWFENGLTLGRLVKFIYRWPELLSKRVSKADIILVGHSFGGSAVSIATGSGAPVRGIILLDPALYNQNVVKKLKRVNVPTVLLGADRSVFRSRKRDFFFRYIPSTMTEVSFRGATHDDAQYPSKLSLQAFGLDPFTTETYQQRFTAAIVGSAMSLTFDDSLNYVAQAIRREAKFGWFKNLRTKSAMSQLTPR